MFESLSNTETPDDEFKSTHKSSGTILGFCANELNEKNGVRRKMQATSSILPKEGSRVIIG
jgi:hypothetical protein